MIDTPSIEQTQEELTAIVAITIPRDRIREVMGPGLGELHAALKAQGIAPAGPWLSHHLRLDPQVFDFEITIPVASPVTPTGRVRPGILRATRAARTIYRGPYEGLGPAWGEFRAWVEAQGLTMAEDIWERYLSGPDASPNPQDWRTELVQPLL